MSNTRSFVALNCLEINSMVVSYRSFTFSCSPPFIFFQRINCHFITFTLLFLLFTFEFWVSSISLISSFLNNKTNYTNIKSVTLCKIRQFGHLPHFFLRTNIYIRILIYAWYKRTVPTITKHIDRFPAFFSYNVLHTQVSCHTVKSTIYFIISRYGYFFFSPVFKL